MIRSNVLPVGQIGPNRAFAGIHSHRSTRNRVVVARRGIRAAGRGGAEPMSSDRGTTMHRGLAPNGEPQGDWAQPTSPSARKLPGAPRERKPALAALAVVLILGGALAAGYLILQSGKRVDAIQITREIGQGQQIPQSEIGRAHV